MLIQDIPHLRRTHCITKSFHNENSLHCIAEIRAYWVEPKPNCIMCVQYRGGCSVPWGVFSTVGGYHEYHGGYLEYRGGCSVPWGIS